MLLMSLQVEERWTLKFDMLNTLIRQKNLCPICHLPLCYAAPEQRNALPLRYDSDLYWNWIQQEVKEIPHQLMGRIRIPQTSNLFGTEPGRVNLERCHYIAATMVPEITRPMLFETPAMAGCFEPEQNFYLWPQKPRISRQHKLCTWNFRDFNLPLNDTRRLMRLNSFLTTMGTRFFLACKDCNMAHTGTYQLDYIMRNVYHTSVLMAMPPGQNPRIRSMYSIYTLIFDSMADYTQVRKQITVTEEKCATWQLEVWLNYCLIMLLAQHTKLYNGTKYNGMVFQQYALRHAHRDMGMCDFYMSQILCTVLYACFDIDVDFIWLHQNFMALLPVWAKDNGFFLTPHNTYASLWRLVMGDTLANGSNLPLKTDLAYVAGNSKYDLAFTHYYWYEESNVHNAATENIKQITHFIQTWLTCIGKSIDARTCLAVSRGQEPPHDLQGYNPDLTRFFLQRQAMFTLVNELSTRSVLIGPNNYPCYQHVLMNPRISTIEKCFAFLGNGYIHQMYENTVVLAFQRMRVAYSLVDPGTLDAKLIDVRTRWHHTVAWLRQLIDHQRI